MSKGTIISDTYQLLGTFAERKAGEKLQELEKGKPGPKITSTPREVISPYRHVPILPALKAWLAPYRGAKGRVAQFDIDREWSRIKKDTGLSNRNRAHRHSFITYRVTLTKNIYQVSLEAGNSPQVIEASYYRPRLEQMAKQYFGLRPGL